MRRMDLRFIDWIWHVRGSLPLPPGQSSDDVFDRLDPLFRQPGTSRQRDKGSLMFTKRNQAAQDRMSVFDQGSLRVEGRAEGTVLKYHLASRALLFCFVAPFFFLAVARLTVTINQFDHGTHEPAKADKVLPMNPIDQALGAPAPEPPKKAEERAKEEESRKPSPTPAYVFAGLFAVLYLVGRLLEDRLVKGLFRKTLLGS